MMDLAQSLWLRAALIGVAAALLILGFALGEPWSLILGVLGAIVFAAAIVLRIVLLVARLRQPDEGPGSWTPPDL